ncbi:endonuclease, partial [Brachyspira hampsonii]|nr:endonuclease [Brachyspira hampsonii]
FLGLNAVSFGSDLRGFLKILRNNNTNDDKKNNEKE